jgi:MinD-like ATPase involved in chromosome partitioning or flagellar assembly
VARNDQDKPGRSLEEQLASLDAVNAPPPEEPDDGAPPPNPWQNTPPAPPFPMPQPPQPGQQPYGYPPAHQPPPFPGAAAPGGEFPGPQAQGMAPGHGATAPTEAYAFPPMQPGQRDEATQFVEQAPPPAADPGGPRYSRFNQQRFDPPPPAEYPPPPEYAPPPAAPPPPEAYHGPAPQTADSLSTDMLLRGRRDVPAGGWRRVVYKASAGVIHPGESSAETRRRELLAHARTPVTGGHYRVAVMSLKGGVGKTTTTVGLGATLASVRGDRVIAVDANPDRGTLSDKVRLETAATVRDLVNEHQQIQRYADVRAFTSQAPSRLEVLASDRDPAASEAFSEEDYRTVSRVLENFYSICITDCGTGLLHSAMAGVLGLADQLILVSSPSVDGARSASATLDWLEAHEYGDLVRGGVVVLSMVRPRSRSTVDIDRLQAHFESRCRAVVRVPYDAHLEEGAEVDLDQLAPATEDAYLTLAATVADAFAWPYPH